MKLETCRHQELQLVFLSNNTLKYIKLIFTSIVSVNYNNFLHFHIILQLKMLTESVPPISVKKRKEEKLSASQLDLLESSPISASFSILLIQQGNTVLSSGSPQFPPLYCQLFSTVSVFVHRKFNYQLAFCNSIFMGLDLSPNIFLLEHLLNSPLMPPFIPAACLALITLHGPQPLLNTHR